jgi:hypothetical protein
MHGPIRKVPPTIARPFTYHVVPVGGCWKVRCPGELSVTSVHFTLQDAVDRAEKLAGEHHHGEVVVHEAGRLVEPLRPAASARRAS